MIADKILKYDHDFKQKQKQNKKAEHKKKKKKVNRESRCLGLQTLTD